MWNSIEPVLYCFWFTKEAATIQENVVIYVMLRFNTIAVTLLLLWSPFVQNVQTHKNVKTTKENNNGSIENTTKCKRRTECQKARRKVLLIGGHSISKNAMKGHPTYKDALNQLERSQESTYPLQQIRIWEKLFLGE